MLKTAAGHTNNHQPSRVGLWNQGNRPDLTIGTLTKTATGATTNGLMSRGRSLCKLIWLLHQSNPRIRCIHLISSPTWAQPAKWGLPRLLASRCTSNWVYMGGLWMTGSNVWGATSDRGAKSPKVSWHGNTEINCAEGESKFLISLGKTLVFRYKVSPAYKEIFRTLLRWDQK